MPKQYIVNGKVRHLPCRRWREPTGKATASAHFVTRPRCICSLSSTEGMVPRCPSPFDPMASPHATAPSMMIRHNSNWPTPNKKSDFFHCPHLREALLLRDRVVYFTCRHYTTCESQRPLFSHLSLYQNRPNAVSASVRVNLELQTVVWVGQHCRVREPFF